MNYYVTFDDVPQKGSFETFEDAKAHCDKFQIATENQCFPVGIEAVNEDLCWEWNGEQWVGVSS